MKRKVGILLIIVLFLTVRTGTVDANQLLLKEVMVINDGVQSVYQTSQATVGDFLKEQDIHLGTQDEINVPKKEPISQEMVIAIKRDKPIKLQINHISINMHTTLETVKDLLEANDITLKEKDHINVSLETHITPHMLIKVDQYKEEVVVEKIAIPYEKEVRETEKLDEGQTQVIQKGIPGERQQTIRVVTLGTEEINREMISEKLNREPVKEIVEEGTGKVLKASSGQLVRYNKMMVMSATAYTASFKDTGKGPDHPQFGITYTGTRAKVGTVAVDPDVIPLGTKLYIEGYGFATAEDIGGAIKGNKIDLYVNTQNEADHFGRQSKKVYIVR